MSDIFISYARSTAKSAQRIAEALRGMGYGVWRDDELPAHRAYGEVIEERLKAAKAVVVIWSAEAVKSEWVRAEADAARATKTLVQLSLDGVVPPLPFNQIQCADMSGWAGEDDAPGWLKVLASIADLAGQARHAAPARAAPTTPRKLSICVLPFANMSGDAEQEYFSDGISEDIITDLSKVSALSVTARNTAFTFKGKSIEVTQIARQLNVGHVLEGSVRKAGARVRITAQLIDGAIGDHVWAERYDRDLTDIFALQDEISEAIVKALKLKLLPEEKQAIERRGTENVEAYDLYLMARQHWIAGNWGTPQHEETVVRLCRGAVEIDPAYARAWALMGLAQMRLYFLHGRQDVDSQPAIEKALALDPDLAEAHALRARRLGFEGRHDEAAEAIAFALRRDPDSYEVNSAAAELSFRQQHLEDAARFFENAVAQMETDFGSPAMLVTCYTALGDMEAARRAARVGLARAEAVLALDRSNGSALAYGAGALATLGEAERARDWIRRALLIDPDNMNMRYNLACTLCTELGDIDRAIEVIGPYFANCSRTWLTHGKIDPDLDPIRDDPRFKAMLAHAEARLAAESGAEVHV
ncbi:MAG: TIR domain-containing protein [Caulobacteraceae bacterium]